MSAPTLQPIHPVTGLCEAYAVLEHNVFRAVQMQVGDPDRLDEQRRSVLSFLQAAEPVRLFSLQFQLLLYQSFASIALYLSLLSMQLCRAVLLLCSPL